MPTPYSEFTDDFSGLNAPINAVEKQKQEILAALAEGEYKFPVNKLYELLQVEQDNIEYAKKQSFSHNQVKGIFMPDKSVTSPTDNPSTSLLKDLFQQVLKIYKEATPDLQPKIVTFVCANTTHTNLALYQSDFNIPIAFKTHKYSCIIQASTSAKTGISKDDFIQPKNFATTSSPETVATFHGQVKSLNSTVKSLEQALKDEQDKFTQYAEEATKRLESKELAAPKIIEVRSFDGTTMLGERIIDKAHNQLAEILQALTATNAMGYPEQLYIYGAPGAGKTHLAKQIAKALGVKCYAFPMGPTVTEGKLLGFNNIATGTFIAGWLYKAYKEGGLVALDEVDLADASVLAAANSIDNDEFIFGNGEIIKRHSQFYLIAFANTIGTGSTKGFIRNTLDAATRDRFTVIKLDYDNLLEEQIYGNDNWARYVQKCRDYVTKHCQASIYITPRATRKGSAYLAAGIPVAKVMEWCIFKGCSEDIKQNILKNVGEYTKPGLNAKVMASHVQNITNLQSPIEIIPLTEEKLDEFIQFSHSVNLKGETKINDIKYMREFMTGKLNIDCSLVYTKYAIENYGNFYSFVTAQKGIPVAFMGKSIYQKDYK